MKQHVSLNIINLVLRLLATTTILNENCGLLAAYPVHQYCPVVGYCPSYELIQYFQCKLITTERWLRDCDRLSIFIINVEDYH